jgi:type I restriction enzyme S subunit
MSVTVAEGLLDREDQERKTETTLSAGQHLLARCGDIAYNMMRMWQGASGLAERDCNVSPAYVVLAPLAGVDRTFASYLFKAPRMLYLFWAYSYGLTDDRLRLYYKEFARIPVQLPDFPVQNRIGAALSSVDHQLETTSAIILQKRIRRQVVIDDLLDGERRFGHFGASSLKSVPIDAVVLINPSERVPSRKDTTVPFVSMSDVMDGGGLSRFQAKPSSEVLGGYSRFRKDDVLVAKITPCFENRKRAVIAHTPGDVCLGSTEFHVLRPQDIESAYLYYATLTSRFQRYGVSHMVGSAGQKRVPALSLRRYLINLPCRGEQRAVAHLLASLDAEIQMLSGYYSAVDALKKMMLAGLVPYAAVNKDHPNEQGD